MEISEERYPHHTEEMKAVAFLPNGKISVSGGSDKSLVLTDLVTKEVICRKENVHEYGASEIAVASDGSFIVTCGQYDSVVNMWDPNDNLKELAELKGHGNNVWSVGVHPNSKLIASGDVIGEDLEEGRGGEVCVHEDVGG